MVKLHIKHGDQSQFLYETTTDTPIDSLLSDVTAIYNGRLKVDRICGGKYITMTMTVPALAPPLTTMLHGNICVDGTYVWEYTNNLGYTNSGKLSKWWFWLLQIKEEDDWSYDYNC